VNLRSPSHSGAIVSKELDTTNLINELLKVLLEGFKKGKKADWETQSLILEALL